jgi:hypothetical protein
MNQVKVHHFETVKPELTLELKFGKDSQIVKFLNHEFITSDDKIAAKIQETAMFKRDFIYFADSPIAKANRQNYRRGKVRIQSGSVGTDANDETAELRRKVAELEAKLAEKK